MFQNFKGMTFETINDAEQKEIKGGGITDDIEGL